MTLAPNSPAMVLSTNHPLGSLTSNESPSPRTSSTWRLGSSAAAGAVPSATAESRIAMPAPRALHPRASAGDARDRSSGAPDPNISDPVALPAREARFDGLAFEARGRAAQPRGLDILQGVD